MKQKLISLRNKMLARLIEWLQYVIVQITKSGVRSQESNYIYQDLTQQYISNIDDLDYPKMTENIDNAIDFSQYQKWLRKYMLWKLNLGLDKEEKYKWKNKIKLFGGNFGMKTNISVGASVPVEKSLGDIDNLTMDKM